MLVVLIVIFLIFFVCSPVFRNIIFNPLTSLKYFILDTYKYFRFKRWREYRKYGTLSIFTGLFGSGKTLSAAIYCRDIYKKYNGKKVFDFKEKKWKIQNIYIVSNIQFNDVPYIPLKSMNDILLFTDSKYQDGVSVYLFVIDEMSTQLNSRDFKSNFNTVLLNLLLTCRHYRFQIIGCSQRFGHVDALVRGVTSTTLECYKWWRIVKWDVYDAWSLENVSDVTKIKPKFSKTVFVKNSDYNCYDTFALVENFKENVKNGNVLTDSEILQYRQLNYSDPPVLSYKKKYLKMLRKLKN